MDAEKLSQLTQKVIGDAAGAVGLLLAYIGDQSKVYTTMDELGPSTVKEIADKFYGTKVTMKLEIKQVLMNVT